MIGDYFSKMATAQKMTPQQLQQSVKDNVLTPDMAQNAQQTPAPQTGIQGLQQPPIAQEVMQQADQMMAPEQIEHKINELKSVVAQVHQGVQSGEIEAYKGIPFIKEQLQKIQMLEAQLPKQGIDTAIPESQIEQQVAQAPEQAPQGIDAAPSNLPTQMAEGGIIGFAVGGMDDDEEDRELEQLYGSGTDNDLIQAIVAGGGRRPIHPSAAVQMEPMSQEVSAKGKHKYEDLVIKEAQRQGLPPEIAVRALYKETGNHPNPETAMSKAGAYGPMQLMAGTAKQMGVDRMDPIQNIQGGIGYLKQQYDKYQDPNLALMAYNAGPGRVDRALRSEKGIAGLPEETRKYVNMAEGGIAHFVNDGLVGPSGESMSEYLANNPEVAAEETPSKPLSKEAQAAKDLLEKNKARASQMGSRAPSASTAAEADTLAMRGIKSLGRNVVRPVLSGPGAVVGTGGALASYGAANALSNATDEELQMLQGDIGSDTSMAASAILAGRKNPTPVTNAPNLVSQGSAQSLVSSAAKEQQQDLDDASNYAVPKPVAAPSSMAISDPNQVGPQYSLGSPPPAAPASPVEKAGINSAPAANSLASDPIVAQYMTDIANQRAESKKNAETNKYLALMQAGFGMMGGTSPYAAVNIGQGAEKGVGTYAALNAATQKEQSDLMNQQLGLYKYQSAAEIGRKRNELTERALGEKTTIEDKNRNAYQQALDRHPQIKSLNDQMKEGLKNGTWDDYQQQQYNEKYKEVSDALAIHYKVDPDINVKLTPITPKPIEKKPSVMDRVFGTNKPTAPTIAPERRKELDSKYELN